MSKRRSSYRTDILFSLKYEYYVDKEHPSLCPGAADRNPEAVPGRTPTGP